MPYFVRPDGAIECATPEEALALQQAILKNSNKSGADETPSPSKTSMVSNESETPSPIEVWTGNLVRKLIANSTRVGRRLLRAALRSDSNLTPQQAAKAMGAKSAQGVGRAVAVIQLKARGIGAGHLPAPIVYHGGEGGRVELNEEFRTAAMAGSGS